MINVVKDFVSEHWVLVFGLTEFVIGYIGGYFKGKYDERKKNDRMKHSN